MGKGPAPVYVVLAGPRYDKRAEPFAVITGKDAEGWAKRLQHEIQMCPTDEALQRLAAKWAVKGFTTLAQIDDVSIRQITLCRCYMTTAEADALMEVDA